MVLEPSGFTRHVNQDVSDARDPAYRLPGVNSDASWI